MDVKSVVKGVVLVALSMTATAGWAEDCMSTPMGDQMETMDRNQDGMVSKEEFTSYHQSMWEQMEKNDHGMFVIKPQDMPGKSMPGKMKGGMQDMMDGGMEHDM